MTSMSAIAELLLTPLLGQLGAKSALKWTKNRIRNRPEKDQKSTRNENFDHRVCGHNFFVLRLYD